MSFPAFPFAYRVKVDRSASVQVNGDPLKTALVAGEWSDWLTASLPIDPKSVPEFRPVDFGFVATITPDQQLAVQRETRIGTGAIVADAATLYGRQWRSIARATPTSVTLATLVTDLQAIPIQPFTGRRPTRFILASGIHFGADRSVELAEACADILWQLGLNCAVLGGANWDTDLGRMVAQAYQAVGFRQTALSTYFLNKGRGGYQGFSFDSNGIEWPAPNPALTAWPVEMAADLVAAGWPDPSACVLQLFHDEMGFFYPVGLREFRILASDGDKQRWIAYLQACGHTLQDLGAASWTWTDDVDEVGPTYRSSVVGPHGSAPLTARIRYYRSARFMSHAAAEQSAQIVAAIRATFPAARVASNFNQIAYAIAGKAQGEATKTADNILVKPIWPEMGAAGVMPWPGLWLNDQSAQDYSYLGARASSAANGGEIGAYLIWWTTGDIPGALAQKALALIAHGAKSLYVWTAGPRVNQLDNGGLGHNDDAIPNIQHMAALIGKAEDVLYDGVRVPAQVACLEPSPASYLFERIDEATPSGLAPTRWLAEHMHTYTVLREACINVKILNVNQIRQGALEQMRVLYVHDPCVSADVQAIIRDWVGAGNVLVTAAGALSRDEFDSPCSILDARRGILSRSGSGWELDAATLPTGKKVTSKVAALQSFNAPLVNERINYAPKVGKLGKRITVLATFPDGSPAIVDRVSGDKAKRGHCLHSGTLPAHIARGVKVAQAAAAAALVRYPVLTLAKIKPLVSCNVPKVEVSALKLVDGYALVLNNWNWQAKQTPISVKVTLHVPGLKATATSAERGNLTAVTSAGSVRVSLPLGPCDVVTVKIQ